MELQEYLRVKEKVSNLQKQRDRTQGVLEQLCKRLKQEYKCNNLEEAKILLFNLEREQEQEESKLQVLMEEFQNKYGDKL